MTGNTSVKFTFEGKEFNVDESKGCYIEVTYQEQVGFYGVNLRGTKQNPYCWQTNRSVVTDDGLKSGNVTNQEPRKNFEDLCRELVKLQERSDAQKAFDKEAACKDLHDFFKELGE